ncbi:MAG: T9SS type A sorting domain-containing protein, partial [Candidatus Eisenbacteria sp.]|nr:T9SS type A sorting domain-containing protein [Candidatus Eisenbacteria bacterium]
GGAIATWHHHNMGTGATMLYVRRLAPGDPLSGWGPLSFPEFQLDEDIDSPDPFLFEEFPAAPEVTLLVGTDPDGKGTQLAGAELSASTGATHWSNTSICELGGYTPRLRAVSDNQGGAIVARVLVSDRTELWALQVDGETGEVDGSATLVAAPTGMQYLIDLCTTGGGGAYVAGGTGDRVFVVRLGLNHAGSAYLVKPDGTGIFPTIQDAINAAAHGDTVLLANGVFTGEGNRDIDFMGKAIVVRSQFGAADSCVIDCEDHGSAVFFQSGEDRASILEGVRLYDARYSAIKCSQTSPTIRDCEFVSNRGTCGGGINCWEASPMISRCLFQANWADNTGGAICWDGGGSLTLDSCTIVANYAASLGGGVFGYGGNAQISHCTILDNLGSTGGGIWLSGDASTEVRNTIVAFSIDGGAIRCGTHSVPLLDCCDIYGNYGGDWVGPIADQLGINGNFTADPYFCDAESGDYHLWNYSPCNQVGCGLIGAWPVGCSDPQAVGPEPRTQALWASVWPNPVSGTAQIRYVLPTATPATLTIYDPAGRVVRSLASHGEAIGTLTWDATDVVGRHVPAGAYFLRLQNGEQETLRRLIVVR